MTLEEIKKWITELDQDEFAAFTAWFGTLQAEQLDRQLEAYSASGQLNVLAEKAMCEFRAGKTKPL